MFSFLNDPITIPKVNTLLMSPFTTRNAIYSKIDREILQVKNGNKGLIKFKMNSL